MPTQRKRFGDIGEALARTHLARQGYSIIESNYRSPYGEIDIVAREGECLVFVEVKSRSNRAYGSPAEAITRAKKQKLVESAQDYIQTHPGLPQMWRIDVVLVEIQRPGDPPRIELIRNAVSEPDPI